MLNLSTITKWIKLIRPYSEIIKFAAVVVLVHAIWKASFSASPDNSFISFIGLNVSRPFLWMANHLTGITHYIINNIFNIETFRYNQQLYFNESPGISIVWACSGVKQYIMLFFALLMAKGSFLRKTWYTPMAIIILYIMNVVRLVVLTLVTRHNIEWFDFTHKVIFRAIIYGSLFILWWFWVEKVAANKVKTV